MKNFLHKKNWNTGVVQVHVEPLPIPLIKRKHDDKSDKDFVKLKLRRYLTSEQSDLNDFKMTFFNNGDQGNFLLFVRNFNTNLAASEMLKMHVKVQYLCILVCGEALR